VIIKLLLSILIPVVSYFIIKSAKNYIDKKFFSKENESNQMINCSTCGTYVHQSIVLKKNGKEYCSKECADS
tara:strand:- start:283 stop:498 length:216 start_codon:yes stop_codon:yes gene_type:complete